MKRWLLFALLLVMGAIHAEVLHPELVLNNIKQIQGLETQGDELYLAVTEFHSNGKNRHYTIPAYPMHWPSDALPQIKDLSIWKQRLKPGESVEVIVSVIEHDMPPWNTDDLIGTLKVRLKNANKQLQFEWGEMGNGSNEDQKPSKMSLSEQFKLSGSGRQYELNLQLLENNSAAMPVQDKARKQNNRG